MNPLMRRRIVGFNQDEEAHWVAELECGHQQLCSASTAVDQPAVGNHG